MAVKLVKDKNFTVQEITSESDPVFGIAIANVSRDIYDSNTDNVVPIIRKGQIYMQTGSAIKSGDKVSVDLKTNTIIKSTGSESIIGFSLENNDKIGSIIAIEIEILQSIGGASPQLEINKQNISDNKTAIDANTVEVATLKPQVDQAVQDVVDIKIQADADRKNINLNGEAVDKNKVLIDSINTKDTTFTGIKTYTDGLVLPFIRPWGTNLNPNDLTPTGVNKDGKLVHYFEDDLSDINSPVVKLPATLDGEPMYKMIRKLRLPAGSNSYSFSLAKEQLFILDYSMVIYIQNNRKPDTSTIEIKRPWELESLKIKCDLQLKTDETVCDILDSNKGNKYKGFYVMLTIIYAKGSPPTILPAVD